MDGIHCKIKGPTNAADPQRKENQPLASHVIAQPMIVTSNEHHKGGRFLIALMSLKSVCMSCLFLLISFTQPVCSLHFSTFLAFQFADLFLEFFDFLLALLCRFTVFVDIFAEGFDSLE